MLGIYQILCTADINKRQRKPKGAIPNGQSRDWQHYQVHKIRKNDRKLKKLSRPYQKPGVNIDGREG